MTVLTSLESSSVNAKTDSKRRKMDLVLISTNVKSTIHVVRTANARIDKEAMNVLVEMDMNCKVMIVKILMSVSIMHVMTMQTALIPRALINVSVRMVIKVTELHAKQLINVKTDSITVTSKQNVSMKDQTIAVSVRLDSRVMDTRASISTSVQVMQRVDLVIIVQIRLALSNVLVRLDSNRTRLEIVSILTSVQKVFIHVARVNRVSIQMVHFHVNVNQDSKRLLAVVWTLMSAKISTLVQLVSNVPTHLAHTLVHVQAGSI